MGRARSALAVRASKESLCDAVLKAFSVKKDVAETFDEFDDVIDFCRAQSEELGGKAGYDAWYIWRVGDWAILGDLSLRLGQNPDVLARLSDGLGEVIFASVDAFSGDACFAVYAQGRTRRLLMLEDDEVIEEGFPIPAEHGHFMDEFGDEELERLWTSYGLPTLEVDPSNGPFDCVAFSIE